MRAAFGHEAVVRLAPGGDPAAPGAAITQALCGRWDHEPPCPLAAHHTAARAAEGRLRLRVLFAAEPADEVEVRRRIEAALRAGVFGETRWELVRAGAAEVTAEEAEHAARLVTG